MRYLVAPEMRPAEVVPTPTFPAELTFPALLMEKRVVVELAVELEIWNAFTSVLPLLSAIPNREVGEVVPMPRVPEVGKVKPVEVAGNVPKRRLPMLS